MTVYVADNPDPILVDPVPIAEQAVDSMPLATANARIAPGPDFHTYLHVDNWMWIPEDQWTELTLTVAAGGATVVVTATPVRVTWDVGNQTVVCPDAGRMWREGMTDAAQTTCKITFETLNNPTGDVHEVSAEVVYEATWTCTGPCLGPEGSLGEVTPPSGDTTTIEVRQRQTVVTG